MARVFRIDGQKIPSPINGFSWEMEDICDEDTGRTLDATMDKNIVAPKKKVSLQWRCVSDKIASQILSKAKANTFVAFTYPSPMAGKDETITVYTGNPKATMIMMTNDVCFWDIDCNFIEK